MRSGYAEINNYNNIGELGISQKAFETIATKACNSVMGAKVKEQKTNSRILFHLDRPVSASIRKNGRVNVHLEVVIKPNIDVQKACLEIQQEVANEIQMMCETIPFDVSINVVSVK